MRRTCRSADRMPIFLDLAHISMVTVMQLGRDPVLAADTRELPENEKIETRAILARRLLARRRAYALNHQRAVYYDNRVGIAAPPHRRLRGTICTFGPRWCPPQGRRRGRKSVLDPEQTAHRCQHCIVSQPAVFTDVHRLLKLFLPYSRR